MTGRQFYKELTRLKQQGLLMEMFRRGVVSHSIIMYHEVYTHYILHKLSTRQMAKVFNTSHVTIARAIRTFK